MKGKIRRATKKDISRILELFNSDPNLTGNDKIKFESKHLQEYINNKINEILVYEIKKEIVAGALVEVWKTAEYIYINDIIVDKKFRRKGIATQLISHVEKLAKKQGINLLFGFTEVKNKKMQNMWKKRKFEKGKKFFFYSKQLK